MKHNLKLSFQKGDILAVLLVILLAVCTGAAFLPDKEHKSAAVAEIYQDQKLIKELPLHTDAVVEIDGDYHNVIEIRNGKVAVTASDCPGEDCVHSGWIGLVGRSIICLPNRVEIRITGTEAEVDFVVG